MNTIRKCQIMETSMQVVAAWCHSTYPGTPLLSSSLRRTRCSSTWNMQRHLCYVYDRAWQQTVLEG